MSTLYLGYVVEVMKDVNNNPTFDLRVIVPSIHGLGKLPNRNLPIAKPLTLPGISITKEDADEAYNNSLVGQKVVVFFEAGNFAKPIYLGVCEYKPNKKSETYSKTEIDAMFDNLLGGSY